MLTRTKYSGKVPLVVGAALVAAVLMALLPLAGCDTNSGSGGNTTTQQAGTGTGGTGGNTGTSTGGTSTGGTSTGGETTGTETGGTSGGGTSTGGGTTGSGTGDNVGTGQNPPATPTTYTVTFNANGGTGTMATQAFTAGTAQKLAANGFSNGELGFNGWNTKQDGTGTKYANLATFTATEDTTLYAQWATAYVSVTAGGATIRYADLESALTTASGSAGSTVYLVQDITVTSLVEISSGTFTLDLNGKTVSANGSINCLFRIAQGATLTVTDSSGLGGSLSAASCGYVINNYGTVTVDRITISASSVGFAAVGNSGNLTVNGGTISSGDYAVKNSGTMAVAGGAITASRGVGVENLSGSTLTVTGGTISSSSTDACAVRNEGTLTVSGGSISSSSSECTVWNEGGTMTVSGGAIMGSGTGVGVTLISGTLKLSGNPVITGGGGNPGLSLSSPITLTGALTGDTTYSVDFQSGSTVAQSDGTYAITAADAQKFFSYQNENVKGTLSGTGTAATVVFVSQ